jgi:mRNA interferase RelE/StbE
VLIAPLAERRLASLPRERLEPVDERLMTLARNPRLAGARDLDRALWRVHAGDFRIVYTIREEVGVVLVVAIADREVVYRLLRRVGVL